MQHRFIITRGYALASGLGSGWETWVFEAFYSGVHPYMYGKPNWSAEELQTAVGEYEDRIRRNRVLSPVTIGHPMDDTPDAFGVIRRAWLRENPDAPEEERARLWLRCDIHPYLVEKVKSGKLYERSIGLGDNLEGEGFRIVHIAFLGGMNPALPDLSQDGLPLPKEVQRASAAYAARRTSTIYNSKDSRRLRLHRSSMRTAVKKGARSNQNRGADMPMTPEEMQAQLETLLATMGVHEEAIIAIAATVQQETGVNPLEGIDLSGDGAETPPATEEPPEEGASNAGAVTASSIVRELLKRTAKPDASVPANGSTATASVDPVRTRLLVENAILAFDRFCDADDIASRLTPDLRATFREQYAAAAATPEYATAYAAGKEYPEHVRIKSIIGKLHKVTDLRSNVTASNGTTVTARNATADAKAEARRILGDAVDKRFREQK